MPSIARSLRLLVVTAALQCAALAAGAGAVRAMVVAADDAGRPAADPVLPVLSSVETAAWAGVALCCGWFAAAVLACARDLARHPARPLPRAARDCLRPPIVRTLLVVMVGGCLATPSPRLAADQGPGWAVLDGLPLPGLPTGAAHRPRPAPAPARVVVRPGDCLWTITATLLGPGADDAAVARAWPRLHRLNRSAIGADPDLLLPGATLRVPAGLDLTTRPDHPRPGAAR